MSQNYLLNNYRMHSKTKTLVFLAIILTIVACSTALYMPTITDAQYSGISVDSLVIGRNLYINKCGKCHNLKQPERFTQKEWLSILPGMTKRAKTTNEETLILTKFVLARCKK
jgi:hypothetical protein